MMDKFNLNFIIRFALAVITCICFSKYYFNHVGTDAVLCTLLINQRVSPDMRATLNVILAVVVGSLTGAIVDEHSCVSTYGNIILPFCLFIFLLLKLYSHLRGSVYELASAGLEKGFNDLQDVFIGLWMMFMDPRRSYPGEFGDVGSLSSRCPGRQGQLTAPANPRPSGSIDGNSDDRF